MSNGIFIFTSLTPTELCRPLTTILFGWHHCLRLSRGSSLPPVSGQRVSWCRHSFLIHSSSMPPFSCTQGHKGCWSLSQLSWQVGTSSQGCIERQTTTRACIPPANLGSPTGFFIHLKTEVHILKIPIPVCYTLSISECTVKLEICSLALKCSCGNGIKKKSL